MTAAPYAYSPITRRLSYVWPGGKKLAVFVCVGVEEYRFGEGITEDALPGQPQPDWTNRAWRDYGNRVGAFRLFEQMAALGLRPAVLLNTDVYDSAPDVLAEARRIGAEIVGHGRSNSDSLNGMDALSERAYVADVRARIAQHEEQPPLGWSSPWLAHNPTTFAALAETGYAYLLDLRLDDRPVWLAAGEKKLLALPYALELNDSTTMIGRKVNPTDFATMMLDEFEEMRAAAQDQPLVMSVVLHSFISGQPFRLRAVMRALRQMAQAEDVWFATPGEIARYVMAEPERAL